MKPKKNNKSGMSGFTGQEAPDPDDQGLPIPAAGGGNPPTQATQPTAAPQRPAQQQRREQTQAAPAATQATAAAPTQQAKPRPLTVKLSGTDLLIEGAPSETHHCKVDLVAGDPGCFDLHMKSISGFPIDVTAAQVSLAPALPEIQNLRPGSRLEARALAVAEDDSVLVSGKGPLTPLVPKAPPTPQPAAPAQPAQAAPAQAGPSQVTLDPTLTTLVQDLTNTVRQATTLLNQPAPATQTGNTGAPTQTTWWVRNQGKVLTAGGVIVGVIVLGFVLFLVFGLVREDKTKTAGAGPGTNAPAGPSADAMKLAKLEYELSMLRKQAATPAPAPTAQAQASTPAPIPQLVVMQAPPVTVNAPAPQVLQPIYIRPEEGRRQSDGTILVTKEIGAMGKAKFILPPGWAHTAQIPNVERHEVRVFSDDTSPVAIQDIGARGKHVTMTTCTVESLVPRVIQTHFELYPPTTPYLVPQPGYY